MCEVIQLIAGDDNKVDFIYRDSDNNAVDLTIYTDIKMQLRTEPGADVLVEISKIEGTIVIENTNKLKCTIKIPQTACGIYEGDMQFETYNDDEPVITTRGRWVFEIIADITR